VKKLGSDVRVSSALTLTVAALVLLIRKTDALLNPQFWAEDGTVFFLQQYEGGASALVRGYAGYLQLVPRLIALFADTLFPYAAIPSVYNYASLLLTLAVIANVFSPRFPGTNRPLLALAVVLVPHATNEVFLNVTNLQWILCLLLILTLLKEIPHERYGNVYAQAAFDFLVVILCGLTGPFIVFLTPLFAWKWWTNKCPYTSGILITALATATIQVSLILGYSVHTQGGLCTDFNVYSSLIGHRLFGGLFLGKDLPYAVNPLVLGLLFICVLIMILWFAAAPPRRHAGPGAFGSVMTLLAVALVILSATVGLFKSQLHFLVPPDNGIRYFYIPYVMLAWSLILCMDQRERWKNVLIGVLLALILASSLTSGFHSKPLADYSWKSYSASIGKEDVTIPINPSGWRIHVKASRE
jgi:hypothetical protein